MQPVINSWFCHLPLVKEIIRKKVITPDGCKMHPGLEAIKYGSIAVQLQEHQLTSCAQLCPLYSRGYKKPPHKVIVKDGVRLGIYWSFLSTDDSIS